MKSFPAHPLSAAQHAASSSILRPNPHALWPTWEIARQPGQPCLALPPAQFASPFFRAAWGRIQRQSCPSHAPDSLCSPKHGPGCLQGSIPSATAGSSLLLPCPAQRILLHLVRVAICRMPTHLLSPEHLTPLLQRAPLQLPTPAARSGSGPPCMPSRTSPTSGVTKFPLS